MNQLKIILSCSPRMSFPLCLHVSSGSQERQDKLREMGFVDILHKLTQASDPNLSDRWATAADHRTQDDVIL